MTQAPERIFNWQATVLSVAQIYGGCRYQGMDYIIELAEGRPLVRWDVYTAECRARKNKHVSTQMGMGL